MSTIQSQFDSVRSIEWKEAAGSALALTGTVGIIASGWMLYALFIITVNDVIPFAEFSRSNLEMVKFALSVPPAVVVAVASARVINIIVDTDYPPRRIALATVGVLFPAYTVYAYLIRLGVF